MSAGLHQRNRMPRYVCFGSKTDSREFWFSLSYITPFAIQSDYSRSDLGRPGDKRLDAPVDGWTAHNHMRAIAGTLARGVPTEKFNQAD